MVRRRRLKRKRPFIIFCLLLAALFYGGYTLYANDFFLPSFELGSSPAPPVNTGQRLNVLLLGVDAREGESQTRTDTIILASVDPKTKQMSLLSIPRDTRVNIPRHGYDRINSAAVYGGPEMSMKVVSELLGIPIKYYVIADFNGFKNIVDALGGVTLEVEQDMYHYDPTDNYAYHIDLSRGLQRLDGDKALQYVRYRGYAMGDIERTAHQQKFLVALGKEMLQPGTILKLPSLIPEVNKYVKTNLSLSDMMKMASAAKSMEDGNFVAQTLPGRPVDIDGISYWGVDPAEARQMVAMLFRGETTTDVVLTTPLDGLPASSGSAVSRHEAAEDEEEDDTRETTGANKRETITEREIKSIPSADNVKITPADESEDDSGSTGEEETDTEGADDEDDPQDDSEGYNPGIPGAAS
ncbi:MAG: LCP family protein [Peptococcaceae bacterium]|nr:LCP family protein [Peptococcaceae bacterium]